MISGVIPGEKIVNSGHTSICVKVTSVVDLRVGINPDAQVKVSIINMTCCER